MSPDEILIRKFRAVDARTSRPVAFEEIAPLEHEIFDDAMELHPFVSHRDLILAMLPRAELPKVFRRLWAHICKKLHFNPTRIDAANGDVKKNNRVVWVWLSRVPLHLHRIIVAVQRAPHAVVNKQ